jgi:hypothetical protein
MSNATELLRQALDYIDRNYIIGMQLHQKIHAYLAAEQEAEPVAYTNEAQLNYLKNPRYRNNPMSMWASVNENVDIPLYTRPEPTRNPLTDEEITDEFGIPRSGAYFIEGVFAGVRFAEKHHGIIPRCENS